MSRRTLQRDGTRRSALTGAAAGTVAYVVGYALTFVLVRTEARETFGAEVPLWKTVAWFHANAHFVDLVASRSAGPFADTETVSLIAEASGSTATVLYALPPLALLAAGLGAARYVGAAEPGDAARAGLPAVVGYGIPAVVVAALSSHAVTSTAFGVEFSATVAVSLSAAVVLAGLLYPAVFATTGAVLWTQLR
jgi:hypothetical protein